MGLMGRVQKRSWKKDVLYARFSSNRKKVSKIFAEAGLAGLC
jgi:hypothetical protein